MKRTIFSMVLVVMVHCSFNAQLPGYKWAKAIGTSSNNAFTSAGRDIVSDLNNNLYMVGDFRGTVDFDPGPNVLSQTSMGQQDVFLAKTDSTGALLWVKCFGGLGNDAGNSIALDANGDILIAGSFSLDVDFNPGTAVDTRTSLAQRDAYISKFDASGNFLWVKTLEGAGNDEIISIALDGQGNIGAAGYFNGSIDFDPGPSLASYSCYGGTDGFACKLDASGSFQWARTYGAWNTLYGDETARDLVFDQAGNLLVIGDFMYNVDFDPGPAYVPMIAGCSIASFLVKLNTAGSLVWVKGFGGHVGTIGSSVGIDKNHNIVVAGTMGYDDPSGDFDPGAGTYTLATNGIQDVYVTKLDSAGNFLWARNFGGAGMDFVKRLTIDRNNNVVTTGEFFTPADFDPSPLAVMSMTPLGGGDNFISMLSASGNFLWAGQLKGYSNSYLENGNAVYAAPNGALYATGVATGGTDFDPSPATATITGFSTSAYALKFYELCTPPPSPVDVNSAAKKKVCINTVSNLSVTAGNPVSWFSSPSSTLSIGSGTTLMINTANTGTFSYFAAATTCSASPRTAITVTVSVCTGLNEEESLGLMKLVPNPASDEIRIETLSKQRMEISIYDVSGKLMKRLTLLDSERASVADLSPGLYLVEIDSEQKRSFQRLIVSR